MTICSKMSTTKKQTKKKPVYKFKYGGQIETPSDFNHIISVTLPQVADLCSKI